MANAHELVHRATDHIFRDDDRARHAKDLAKSRLAVLILDLR